MKRKDKKGSILVEALLTVVILSVGITVIIQSMTSSLRARVQANDYTLAVMGLENVLTLQLQDSLLSGLPAESYQEEDVDTGEFRFNIETGTPEDIDIEELDTLTASVYWQSGHKANEITVETFKYVVSAYEEQ